MICGKKSAPRRRGSQSVTSQYHGLFEKKNGRGPSSEGDQVPGFNALLQATVRSSQWPQSQGPRDGGGLVGLTLKGADSGGLILGQN